MTNNEIKEKVNFIYSKMYNPNFLIYGLYSKERAELDAELRELRKQCTHIRDNGESAIEYDYCIICGEYIKNKEDLY